MSMWNIMVGQETLKHSRLGRAKTDFLCTLFPVRKSTFIQQDICDVQLNEHGFHRCLYAVLHLVLVKEMIQMPSALMHVSDGAVCFTAETGCTESHGAPQYGQTPILINLLHC